MDDDKNAAGKCEGKEVCVLLVASRNLSVGRGGKRKVQDEVGEGAGLQAS